MSRRFRRSVAAFVGAMALTSTVSAAAATSTDDEGRWYFDWYLVQNAHDEGITGKGVTIAMIDSPVNLDIPTLAGRDIRVQDAVCVRADGSRPAGISTDYAVANHGTDVLSYLVGSGAGFPEQTGIKGLAPDATVLTYAVQLEDEHDAGGGCPGTAFPSDYQDILEMGMFGTSDEIGASMHAAMDAGADIISVSMGVAGSSLMAHAIARAVREGVIIVAALPNEANSITGSAPARANGVLSVDLIYADGELTRTGYSEYVDVVAPGAPLWIQGDADSWETQRLSGGTSLATPIVAGNLALAMQKYPDTTPNQLIQSLIHNTDAEPHDLIWDSSYGYGEVITDVFLAADPTVYPDVNPLVANFANYLPLVDEIWPGAVSNEQDYSLADRPWPVYTPEPTAPSTSPAAETDADSDSDPASTNTAAPSEQPANTSPGWLIPAIVFGALLLVALATVITVVAIRSNRSKGEPDGTQ